MHSVSSRLPLSRGSASLRRGNIWGIVLDMAGVSAKWGDNGADGYGNQALSAGG